ncbi:hypothetical protein PGN35_003315 [Nodosilinea sp. PGN35]|uniref:hypothetical protein n=1 Tax=Nodosilinea sp. PGN35 TaxID=3020489 RepID=UPI0023B2CCC4|nr:hypothetical protein [Nodosilinea sp. TSF1-S3]MDF0365648.1 hypothetical protein [Nodosilinea sp. TSF1-S3]
MTSQQLEERSQRLEARVAALETELAQLKQVLSALLQKPTPWWSAIAGSAETDQATPLSSQPSPLAQTTFHQTLQASGLVKSVRPPAVTPQNNFQPIPVQGEAVSQTILDERR